jgi:hypothetical protein
MDKRDKITYRPHSGWMRWDNWEFPFMVIVALLMVAGVFCVAFMFLEFYNNNLK